MPTTLEDLIESISYDTLGLWRLPSLDTFSNEKNLFEYQQKALRNITKVLHEYFTADDGKAHFAQRYQDYGADLTDYGVPAVIKKKANKSFSFLREYYPLDTERTDLISGQNFLNQACFWMATGSGKSLVLIKTVELLDHLQRHNLIPTKDIMILLPRDELITQFRQEVEQFNKSHTHEKHINLVNLKHYEEDKRSLRFSSQITVYYYRSDLMRAEKKENTLDYRTYDNQGNWYIFLDEAHRGEKLNKKGDASLVQQYISILSRNGFLFNFSATFTNQLDYLTTCYNFNLQRFIQAGYGKNIYLNQSIFEFTNKKDEFSQRQKQKQVLKSLLTYTIIRSSREQEWYHTPLLMTLVNSVNTKDADLLLFFQKLEEVAYGHIDTQIFTEAQEELAHDFRQSPGMLIGEKEIAITSDSILTLTISDILQQVFNSSQHGKIEMIEGEKGKELAFKLETSDQPFALIKIGDVSKFHKNQLGQHYVLNTSFETKHFFAELNSGDGVSGNITLLMGSRSFIEGWDSNRPNVLNMINIGSANAKKFVLQGIGRGVRIQPDPKNPRYRQRLPHTDTHKNPLLETLCIFATDKKGIQHIVTTVKEQKVDTDETVLSIKKNPQQPFDLLIPQYTSANDRQDIAQFYIANESRDLFLQYLHSFSRDTLLLKTQLSLAHLNFLLDQVHTSHVFQSAPDNVYRDMEALLWQLIQHISVKNQYVSGIREMQDDIVHFKHIKASQLSSEEVKRLQEQVDKVSAFGTYTKQDVKSWYELDKIDLDEYTQYIENLSHQSSQETFRDVEIIYLAQHYYLPVIRSTEDKVSYLRHIIDEKSEIEFLQSLQQYISDKEMPYQWMFSKIDERKDSFYIPYFDRKNNQYRKFYPDFIFWVTDGYRYKIVFIDPKGISQADYQNKVDGFEHIFLDNDGAKRTFSYKNYQVHFDLKLVSSDKEQVGEKYRPYWITKDDLGFLENVD